MGFFNLFGSRPNVGSRQAVMFRANGLVTILCGLVTVLCLRGALVLDEKNTAKSNPYQLRKETTSATFNKLVDTELDSSGDIKQPIEKVDLDEHMDLEDGNNGSGANFDNSGSSEDIADKPREVQREELTVPENIPQVAKLEGGKKDVKMMIVTAEEPDTCPLVGGDKMFMKAFKNKVDYCRIRGYCQVWYSLEFWDPNMDMFWRKGPILKPLMEKHKDIEWFMWMDSDALFTDMAFDIPLDEYDQAGLNIIFPGAETQVYDKADWLGVNAGIFVMRNCDFSMEFLDMWMELGRRENRVPNGKIISEEIPGRPQDWEADDQGALVYLLRKHRDEWSGLVKLEESYRLHGYWSMLVDSMDDWWKNGNQPCEKEGCPERWPFITHFCGCKLCFGKYATDLDKCLATFNIAYHFADNQVLHHYGMEHINLNSSAVVPRKEPEN
eukprot:TRINITY_DN9313_c0_g3_i1.p1 TRINITY_DN9313_c0_g3~~TRINITY_DN9313_c0_g3_i1.p1  ORF type:complete len:440 (+),score=85.52 TRINITY_DN9313_c0_g3_i1:112-1431(+)